jgi:hypothetical protein
MGGKTYVAFGDQAYLFYIFIFVMTLASSFIFLCARVCLSVDIYNRNMSSTDIKRNIFTNAYVLLFLFFCLGCLFYYWNSWPFLKALSGVVVDRPDIVSGDFENYFLISVFFQIVVPFSYFYFYGLLKKSFILNAFFFSLVCFFLVASGNKAVLLFFFIFCFLFLFKKFSFFRLLSFLIVSLFVYFVMKGGLADQSVIKSLIESATRRFFITQGMGVPNAFELHINSLDFSELSSNQIKSEVFRYVYGYLPGSMPVFYIAEAYLRWGWLALLLTSFLSPVGFAVSSVFIERQNNLAIGWVYYYFVYAFVMSGFSLSNGYRLVFCILFIVGYFCCAAVRKKGCQKKLTEIEE